MYYDAELETKNFESHNHAITIALAIAIAIAIAIFRQPATSGACMHACMQSKAKRGQG